MPDSPALAPNAFEALAEGIFNTATDAQSGQDALVEAYSSNNWADPKTTLDSLGYYGEQLKNLYKDQSGVANIGEVAPVKFADIVAANPDGMSDISLYNSWEKENLDYIKNAEEPNIVANKRGYSQSVEDFASKKRAETYGTAKHDFFGDSVGGAVGQATLEVFQGMGLDTAAMVYPGIKKYATEVMDPGYAQSWDRAVAGAGANAIAFTVAPGTALLGASAGAAQSTYQVGTETARKTGDTGAGWEAAGLELAGQTVGLAGERLGFGNAIKGTSALKTAAILGGTAGYQTIFSNAAQNLEAGKPVTTDVTRGVDQSVVIGAGAGAITHVAAHAGAPSESAPPSGNDGAQPPPKVVEGLDNSQDRAQEIEEMGSPVTPITKQEYGPKTVSHDSTNGVVTTYGRETSLLTSIENLDNAVNSHLQRYKEITTQDSEANIVAKPGKEEELADLHNKLDAAEAKRAEWVKELDSLKSDSGFSPIPKVEDDGTVTIDSKENVAKTTPLYEFEDGTVDTQSEEGHIVKQNGDGTSDAPFDDNFYVDEPTAKNINAKISSGEAQLTFDGAERPILVSTDGTDTVIEPIQGLESPAPGLYRVGLSADRSPNKLSKVRPVYISPKIRTVLLDRSVGAAGEGVAVQQKETTFSQRLRATEGLPGAMNESGKEGIFYTPISFKEADRELASVTQNHTVAGLVDFLKSDSPEKNPELEARATSLLTNAFKSEFAQAAASGDTAKLDQLNQAWSSVNQELALKRTSRGRQLRFLAGADLESVTNIQKSQARAFDETANTEAEVEGVTPAEVKNPEIVDQQVQATQRELEDTKTSEEQPLAQQEQAYQDLVTEIESQGQTAAEAENLQVANDIKNIQESTDKAEAKLLKKKNKSIAVVEEQIANDTQELVNNISTAQELSGATKEEIDKANVDRGKKLADATETANTELKAAVDQTKKEAKARKEVVTRSLQERYTTAKAGADKIVAGVNEKIRRYKIRQAVADDATKIEIQKKIDAEGDKLVRARTRELQLKDQLDLAKGTPEIDKETQDLLRELEQGVVIHHEPKGKTRNISVKTKKSGLNLVQLFKKSGGNALPTLAALHDSVNKLAGTFKQSGEAKGAANARIEALQNKISKNRQLVEKAKGADHASKAERNALDAARKQLKALHAREAATPESKLKAPERRKLELYRSKLHETRKARAEPTKSEKVSALEQKLKDLVGKKEKVSRANTKAKKASLEAVKKQTENQLKIDKLQAAIDLLPEGASKRDAETKLAIMKGASQGNSPPVMDLLHSNYRNGIMAGIWGHVVGLYSSSGISYPYKIASVIGLDIASKVKGALKGETPASIARPFLRELFSKENWAKGTQLALDVGASGKRIGNKFKDSELGPEVPRVLGGAKDPTTDSHYLSEYDWLNDTRSLTFEPWGLKTAPRNIVTAISKVSGHLAGRMNRLYPIVETFHGIPFTEAFQAAAAQYYYNRGKAKGVDVSELKEFLYDSKANRAKAETAAADYSSKLREAGLPFSERQQRILEEEVFQNLAPRLANMDAIKQVGQVNLNTPARGVSGAMGQWLASLNNVPFAGHAAKFITPFIKPVANLLGMAIEITPVGLGTAFAPTSESPKGFQRSPFEKNLAVTSAVLGTVTMGAITQLLLGELEKPEKDRFFDIVGNKFSSDKAKSAAFKQQGGTVNSIRIGDTYLPYGETPLTLMLGSIGAYADQVRDGKVPQPEMLGALGMIVMSAPSSAEQVSMLRGITEIHDTLTAMREGRANGKVASARILMGMVKGTFIPATGLLRNITRFTDAPVDGWKDIKSAMVEGIPVVQSEFGKPALNLFGEPMPTDTETIGMGLGLHRVFSLANSDLDARWLSDSGYTIPTVNNLKLDKTTAKAAHLAVGPNGASLRKIDYDAKRAIALEAGPQMRAIVSRYRERYGVSATQEHVQKNLKSEINKVLARAKLHYFKEIDTQEEE